MDTSKKYNKQGSRFASHRTHSLPVSSRARLPFKLEVVGMILVISAILIFFSFQKSTSDNAGFAARDTIQSGSIEVDGVFVEGHSHQHLISDDGSITGIPGDTEIITPLLEYHDHGLLIRRPLRFANAPPTLQPGDNIHIIGYRDGSDFVALSTSVTQPASLSGGSSNNLAGSVTKRFAVILAKFPGLPDSYTTAFAKARLFTDSDSVASFLTAASHGTYHITNANGATPGVGDVFGWVTISDPYTTCNPWGFQASATQAAASIGFNPTNYDYFIYMINDPFGCSTVVWGDHDTIVVPSHYTISPNVIDHEGGHSGWDIGEVGIVAHANDYDCVDAGGQPVSFWAGLGSTCSSEQYGDGYSFMGGKGIYTGKEQELLGWIPSSNALTVSLANAGTYQLYPVTSATLKPDAIYSIRVPITTEPNAGAYYYLETRRVHPNPAFNNILLNANKDDPANRGVMVRLSSVSGLIDAHPGPLVTDRSGTHNENWDAAINPGETLTDVLHGIQFKVIESKALGDIVSGEIAEYTTVQISFICQHGNPTIGILPTSQNGAPGATRYYDVTVQNADSPYCGSSTFNVVPTLPSGWTSTGSYTQTLAPGLYQEHTIGITPPSDVSPADYPFTFTATNTEFPSSKGQDSAIYTVVTPDTTPPTVTITSPTNGATISNGQVTLSANVMDASPIDSVQFFINNMLIYTDVAAPYSTNVNANNPVWIKNANNIIRVTASDFPPQGGNPNVGSTQVTVFHT